MRPGMAVAGVTLLGAGLRLVPIWFGLPYPQARPDETTVLGHALAMLGGDPNPHFFNWPSLTFYFVAGVFQAARSLDGTLAPETYTILARGCMALAGTATILILIRLAQRITDTATALVAGLLLAVATLHVRESHFAMTDTLMTLLATGCLLLLVEAGRTPRAALFALAGLAGGLAASTKYSAAALLAAVFAQHGQRPADAARLRLVFVAAFAGGFLAGTPYAILDVDTFRADVLFERAHLATGHTGGILGRGWAYHLAWSLPYGLGIPTFVAAIAGVWPVWRRREARPLLLFAAAFFLAIGSGRTVFFRYVLPLLPLACLFAAVAISTLAVRVASRFGVRSAAVIAVVALAVAAPPLVDSVTMDWLLARTDTRVLAADWLAPRLSPDDTLHDAGGDYTKLDLARSRFHEWRYDAAAHQFMNAGTLTPDWMVLYDYAAPLQHYAASDHGLRALAQARYTLVHHVVGRRAGSRSVFDREDAFFLPIHGFNGVERPGPNVSIYRRVQ